MEVEVEPIPQTPLPEENPEPAEEVAPLAVVEAPQPVEAKLSLDIDRAPTSRRVLHDDVYARHSRLVRVDEIRPEQIDLFLESMKKTGQWEISANRAGLNSRIIKKIMRADDDFRVACENAEQCFVESLVQSAITRAQDGWEEPIMNYKTGTQMGSKRVYDGKLMELLLKRYDDRFKEKFTGDVKVHGGVIVVPMQSASVEAWEKQAALPAPTTEQQ